MKRLGRYELGEILGSGGAGTVYDATRVGPGPMRHPVAVKVLHSGDDANLEREARLGGLLRHRNLVDVYEIGEEDGTWFCAMERCVSELREHVPLPPRAVVEVGLQVCAALQYAHEELGLVHLDLKPANLLVGPRGEIKVADLGIAQVEGFEREKGIRGTPGYMAPEQASGRDIDSRADIYALGVTLSQLATGRRPGRSSTTTDEVSGLGVPIAAETMDFWTDPDTDVPASEQPGLSGLPGVPDWLMPVVGRCLEAHPDDRWPDMASLAEALRGLTAEGAGLGEVLNSGSTDVQPVRNDTNLPEEGIPAVGRSQLLETLLGCLEQRGLLSLYGPAGVGKSALAVATTHRWRDATRNPAWVCRLAEVDSHHGLYAAVGQIFGLDLGDEPKTQIAAVLARQSPLAIVFDDADLVPDLEEVLLRWQADAPDACLIVTRRARLDLDSPQFQVPPLDEDAAVQLLVECAKRRGVQLSEGDALRSLARQLDGLPLALELAAGRLGVLTVEDVVERLGLGLLRDGHGGRHGTLRAALQLSWDQLDDDQQLVLSQVSIFRAPFTLEAVEGIVEATDLLPLLEELADRSMIRVYGDRLDLLGSMREFAREQLTNRDLVERRHGAWFAQFGTRRALDALDRPGGREQRNRLAIELDDILAACRRAAQRGASHTALCTLRAAWAVTGVRGPYAAAVDVARKIIDADLSTEARVEGLLIGSTALYRLGSIDEATRWLDRALDLSEDGRLFGAYGLLHRNQGDLTESQRYYEMAVDRHRLARNQLELAWTLAELSVVHRMAGDHRSSRDHVEASLSLFRRLADRRGEAKSQEFLAVLCEKERRLDEASNHYQRALEAYRSVGDQRNMASTWISLGDFWRDRGKLEEAESAMNRGLQVMRSLGDRRGEASALVGLAILATQRGELEIAASMFEEAASACASAGDRWSVPIVLGNVGAILERLGRPREAVPAFQQALKRHREVGNLHGVGLAVGNLGVAHFVLGETSKARGFYEQAVALYQEIGDRLEEGRVQGNLSEVHEAQGRPDQARHALRQAIELARDTKDHAYRGYWLARLARIERDDPRQALALLDEGEGLLQEVAVPSFLAQLHAIRAEVLALNGNLDRAHVALDAAVAAAPEEDRGAREMIDSARAVLEASRDS